MNVDFAGGGPSLDATADDSPWTPTDSQWQDNHESIGGGRRDRDHRGTAKRRQRGPPRQRCHPHGQGARRRTAFLSRGGAAVLRGREGPVADPLAVRPGFVGQPAAGRALEPAGVRELPLVLRRWPTVGHGRRLRQRQRRLRAHRRRAGDGAQPGPDHHLERLPAGRQGAHLRPALAGFARRPLRREHGQGPFGVRRQAGVGVLAIVLPNQGNSGGL